MENENIVNYGGNKKRKNKVTLLIVIVSALLLAGSIYGAYYFFNTKNYVATVGGEEVSKAEYKFFLAQVKNEMESSAGLTDESAKKSFWMSSVEGKSVKEMAKQQALDRVEDFKIQYIEAKKNTKLDSADIKKVDSTVDSVIKKSGSKSQADIDLQRDYGVTLDEYTNLLKDLMLTYKFIKNQEAAIKVDDSEIKQKYQADLDNGEYVTVVHILFRTLDEQQNPLSQDKIKQSETKANEILGKVKANENITELAKQYSEDPGVKVNNGEYTFKKGKMVKEFEDWAFSAKVGDTGIIKTTYGYHVIKRMPLNPPVFETVKNNIKQEIIQEKYSKQIEKWRKQHVFKKNTRVINSIKV